jgi:hypothetical protein
MSSQLRPHACPSPESFLLSETIVSKLKPWHDSPRTRRARWPTRTTLLQPAAQMFGDVTVAISAGAYDWALPHRTPHRADWVTYRQGPHGGKLWHEAVSNPAVYAAPLHSCQ